MQTEILKIEPLNANVNRITTDDNYVIDVHAALLPCQSKDRVKITFSELPIRNPTYMMFGTVYNEDRQYKCISNGGLLMRIPSTVIPENARNIYTNISISNVRKRDDSNIAKRKRTQKGTQI